MNNSYPAKNGKSAIALILCLAVAGFANSPSASAAELQTQSPDGSNVVINKTVYYLQPSLTSGNTSLVKLPESNLTGYSSEEVFASYGFNSWGDVVSASAGDVLLNKTSGLMPYADSTLVNDNGTVYVISNGSKHGISSNYDFQSLGYNWGSVIKGNTSFMSGGLTASAQGAHMPGTLINQNGTIYYITSFGKMGFPSMFVFNSWGFKLSNVVIANNSDLNLPVNSFNPVVPAWTMGELSPSANPRVAMP